MSTVKISLTFAFSFFSNGLVKYQCPSWPELDGVTQFVNFRAFEKRMSHFLQENIKATLEYTDSPFCIFPETIWLRQTMRPNVGQTTIEVPVNANLTETLNQDQTLFPITVYYLIYGTYETFYVLWIPLIGKYVQVKRSDNSERQKTLIREEVKKAIYGHTKGNWKDVLVESGCITSFEVQHFTFSFDDPTLTEHYLEQLRQEDLNSDVSPAEIGLKEIVQSEDGIETPQFFGLESQVERMNESLFLDRPISVLIVGEPGVGKTSLWKRFAQLATQTPNFSCYSTTPILLGANDQDDTGFQPDSHLVQIVRFAKQHRGAYYMGNLWELNQVGQYFRHPVSIADYLVPYLERKSIGIVVECNNEQFADLEQSKPGLIHLFDVIKLEPSNTTLTNEILRKSAEYYSNIKISEEAISTITALYNKYSAYENLPGAAVKFLDLLLSKNANIGKKEISKSDVIDFFTLQTGLPNFLLDPAIPFDKSEAKRFFTSRVIGQDGSSNDGANDGNDDNAVDTVVALLETVKSGLTRQTGPIATLLFIGPTGVGKTEMAKALAEYLYSDPGRMIRLDMSEYSDPTSADRLINGLDGGEGILTSQVRAQPFGVVLLDEFEKADPSVFDMFLQVMGEGRLTDSQGHLAVFNNCVIILTSNLGVDTYRKTSLAMHQSKQDTTQQHFTDAVAKLVRPELLNRIDRVVPFSPLSKPVLRQILNLEFNSINRRLGVRWRQLNISYDEAVIDKLVQLGFSPKFGARPLRRTVERYILHPLAEALAKRNSKTPYDIHFSLSPQNENSTENSGKPEHLFNITIKSSEKVSNSKKPTVSSEQITKYLQLYRSFVLAVNAVYKCDYVESLQSQVLYEEQCLEEQAGNNPYFNQSNRQQTLMLHNMHKDIISRLYQIRQKALSLENEMVYEFLTSKERFSQRILGESSANADFVAANNEWKKMLEDLFFCAFPNEKYIAYFNSEDTVISALFELLLKAIIPIKLFSRVCLYTNNLDDIMHYLNSHTQADSAYRWVDQDNNIRTEKDKGSIMSICFPHVSKDFKYMIIDCDPFQLGRIYKENELASNSSMFSIETSDRYAIVVLAALGGSHTFEGVECHSDGEWIIKELNAYLSLFPYDLCQSKLQSSLDNCLSWMQHRYRFSSSKLPKEYSSDKVFNFSCSFEQTKRIPFDIESLKSYFDSFIYKFLYEVFV